MTKQELIKRVQKNQIKAVALEKLELHLGCPGYFQEEIALLAIPFHDLMQDMETKIAEYQKKKMEIEAEMDDLIEIGRQLEQRKA
ncbi:MULTISPECIES: hypothetical protein [Listeria]|uniref:hypothetical protein n=1 Tax=Listeria TaxID=1637 RepID=UPI000B59377A|nr:MULTISPECIES: hypothetical protein [Listeria]